MKKTVLIGLLAIVLAFSFAGCDDRSPNPSIEGDDRVTLTAGGAVDAGYNDTSASVTFTGAAGVTGLAAADFTVSSGGTIKSVNVSSGTVTVAVGFAANTVTTPKTYTVSIAAGSELIKGSATVTITQKAFGDDRVTLAAGGAVSAGADEEGADVTFTGATGLTLAAADFSVTSPGTITAVDVTGGTATVSVSFAKNTATTARTYTVSIASGSTKISGSATVTITQAAGTGPVEGEPIIVDFEDDSWKDFFEKYNKDNSDFVTNDPATDENHTAGGSSSWKVKATGISEYENNHIGLKAKTGVFTVKPDKFYQVSYWIKTDQVDKANVTVPAGGWPIGAGIEIYCDARKVVTLDESTVDGTNAWMEKKFIFETGDESQVTITLELVGTGTVWFDDFEFKELPPPEFITILDVDFEDDTITPLWDYDHGDKATVGIVSTESHSGDKSYEFSITSPSNGPWSQLIGKFDVTDGKSYRLSFWVKTDGAVISTENRGVYVVLAPEDDYDGFLWNSENITDANGEWKEYTTIYTADETRELVVIFWFCCTAGSAWFDDISIVELRD
jgi:hypothetical protein